MHISYEDASTTMGFRALEEGEGFVVTFSASLGRQVPQDAKNQAHKQDITGQRLNVHRDTLPEAIQALTDESNAFATELVNFIETWNSEHG